jgi:hypothetical protein
MLDSQRNNALTRRACAARAKRTRLSVGVDGAMRCDGLFLFDPRLLGFNAIATFF